MNKEEKCCEKCEIIETFNERYCKDKLCPCHTSPKEETKTESWEDKLTFLGLLFGVRFFVETKDKDIIYHCEKWLDPLSSENFKKIPPETFSSLIKDTEKRVAEEIVGEIEKNEGCLYSGDINYITNLIKSKYE